MSKTNALTGYDPYASSGGGFPSSSSLKSRSSEDLRRLYYQTTSSGAFSKRNAKTHSPRGRSEDMGQILNIGSANTKYMPVQLNHSPLANKNDCQYTKDFFKKPSECRENRALAVCFSGAKVQVTPAPMLETTSHQTQNFKCPSKAQLAGASQHSSAPATGKTQINVVTNNSLETKSSSHQSLRAPPRFKPTQRAVAPLPNLAVPRGQDCTDCFRTSYASEFRSTQKSAKRSTSDSFLPRIASLDERRISG